MTDSKKRAEIVSSFTDAGTGERFTAGDTPLIDAGTFDNYEAAGLVRTPRPQRKSSAAATKAPRKPARRAKAPSAPAAAPVPAEPPAPAPGGDAPST